MALGVALLRAPGSPSDPALAEALTSALGQAATLGDVIGDAATLVGFALAVVAGDAVVDDAGVAGLRAFVGAGGALLGLGPGFAALCRAGLLPGAIEDLPAPRRAATHVRVEGRATAMTWAIPAGRIVPVDAVGPTACYVAGAATEHVILRYCDRAGGTDDGPGIAGVSDASGRVVGLFPGRAVPGPLTAALGRQVIASLSLARDR